MTENIKNVPSAVDADHPNKHSIEFRSGKQSLSARGWGLVVVVVIVLTIASLRVGGFI